jgi:hypothetical protein
VDGTRERKAGRAGGVRVELRVRPSARFVEAFIEMPLNWPRPLGFEFLGFEGSLNHVPQRRREARNGRLLSAGPWGK